MVEKTYNAIIINFKIVVIFILKTFWLRTYHMYTGIIINRFKVINKIIIVI